MGHRRLLFSLLSLWFPDAISATNPRVIDDSRARKLSNDLKRCTYYETCATYGLNVERVFQDGNCSRWRVSGRDRAAVLSQRGGLHYLDHWTTGCRLEWRAAVRPRELGTRLRAVPLLYTRRPGPRRVGRAVCVAGFLSVSCR